jgi:hypothetical protein
MKLHRFYLIAVLAGTLAVIGCGSDSSSNGGNGGNGGDGNGTDPSAFCNEDLCATSGPAKTGCEQAVAICLEIPIEAQRDECIGAAVLAWCKVEA